ncbi:MAG: kelch repeat-containing protein [Polyangiaceae bacterium]
MAAPPPLFVARSRAAVVATGKSVFFWGGQDGNGNALDTGAIYDPNKNTWKFVPKDVGGPVARMMASAVWTGSVVIVFGGTDALGNPFRDGAIYDPAASQWTTLPANPGVSRRSAPYSFWDGTRAFFYGGLGMTSLAVPYADRFDLTNWSLSSMMGDPGAILSPGIAFDGATMYLFGGQLNNNRQDRAYSYTSSTNVWTKLANSGLSPRSGPFTVWDGTRLVVWGGRDDNGLRSDGSYLLGAKWTALASFGAPSPCMIAFRRSGWGFQISPGVIAMVGGQVSLSASATLTTSGAFYNVASSTWTTIPSWPSNEAHEYGMGAWTGEEFVLWGGRDSNGVTSTGERWAP